MRELLKSRALLYHPFELPKKQHPYPGKKRNLESQSARLKYRQIGGPAEQLKVIQRRILRRVLSEVDLPPYMFGAVAGKTLVQHAEQHVKNQSTTVVRMDISSYYPNITCDHVYTVWRNVLNCPPPVARILTELTTFDFHLPQGAPTSPAIANIFLASIYAPICLTSEQKDLTITTWVDDLIFSGNAAREVMCKVREVLASNGLKDTPRKREIFGTKSAKIITGVRIGRFGARAPREKMSELRAALYRLATGKVKPKELERYRQNLVARIAHVASIHRGDAEKLISYAKTLGVRLKTGD